MSPSSSKKKTELSIFLDESGDFGTNSKYYLLTLVFHDQDVSIDSQLERLRLTLLESGYLYDNAIHTGPLVRKEDEYQNALLKDRRKIFDKLLTFARTCDIRYKTFCVSKKEYPDRFKLKGRLSRELSLFLRDMTEQLVSFDRVIIYYDNGQSEITDLINTVLSAVFFEYEIRKVDPSEYRLFQCADLFCTLELLRYKDEHSVPLTNSELIFFESRRRLRKDYLKTVDKLRIP